MTTKTAKRHHRPHPQNTSGTLPAPRPATRAAVDRDGPRTRARAPRHRRRGFDPSWTQIVVAAAILVVGAIFLLAGRGSTGGAVENPTTAPGFTMPSTDGGTTSLGDLAGRNVLLYFNEGVGCDACFYQTVELERAGDRLVADNIALVPIVMNPIDQVRGELARFGITTPYLIDTDGAVSAAYGVLGKGMHANLPGHGFVFIDSSGRIRWQKEYPSMYASAREVLDAVDAYTS
jgi:peroxiredoxin